MRKSKELYRDPSLWTSVFLILCGLQTIWGSTPSKSSSDVTGKETTNTAVVSMEDVSQHSSSFLSGLTTIPSLKFKDGRVYSLEVKEPDDEIMNQARQKIGETPEGKKSAIEELRNVLKNDKNLNTPLENDAWLVRFLRARSYNVAEAHKLITRYYRFKDSNKSLFDMVPTKQQDTFEQEVLVPLDKRDQGGRRVVIVRASKWNQKEYPVERMSRMITLFLELGLYEPATQLAGVQIILDMKDATREQALTIASKMLLVNKMFFYTLKSVPIKFEGFHVVNEPKWFWGVYNTLKSLMWKELTKPICDKLHVHGTNWSSLHKFIGATYLPENYGGKFPFPEVSSQVWEVLLKFGDVEYKKIQTYGVQKKPQTKTRSSSTRKNPLRVRKTSTTRKQ